LILGVHNLLIMKIFLASIFILLGCFTAFGQIILTKGVPSLENYLPEQYGQQGKIWDIHSAKNGIVYMASDNGLLEFDGKTWNSYRDYKGFTRSLLIANDSVIYTSSDLDFGVWKKNKFQELEYTSLYPFKNDSNHVSEEFWHIFELNDKIVFTSFSNIYVYKNRQITKISAPTRFSRSFSVNNKIYLADEKLGLYAFDGISLKHVFKYSDNTPFQISGIYENEKGLNIITNNRGIYQFSAGKLSPLETEVSLPLKKYEVFSFTTIDHNYLAFGTLLNGLYITDTNGKIIQHISKNKGLPNNTILSMGYASNGKLWIGMDYGITAMDLKNNITYIYDYKGEFGTAYTKILKDSVFYLGTNQGLYKTNWSDLNNNKDLTNFSLINGSEGQVWSLENIDGNLMCGHDKGLFAVENNSLKKIYNEHGVWAIKLYKKDYLLTGNYNGINVFKRTNNSWEFLKKIDLIWGSVNQIEFENDQMLWVNIPNFGVIRFSLNDQFQPVDRLIIEVKNFEGDFPNLFKDKQGIKIITSTNQYLFNTQNQKFYPQKINVKPKKINNLISGFYQADTLNNSYVFYPVYNGFALENFQNNPGDTVLKYPLLFRKAEAFNNTETKLLQQETDIPFQLNNLRFSFIVPVTNDILYQYKLENLLGEWSDWNSDNTLELMNLKEGDYKLLLRAKSKSQNIITDIQEFDFTVSPPWYRSWFAYLGYVLFLGFFLYLLRRWQLLKLKRQKFEMLKKEQNSLREQGEKYKQDALLKKQEQLQTEKKILKQQVRDKTIELAKKAKSDDDKNRLLHVLKDKIHEVDETPSKAKMRLLEMRRLLDSYLEIEDKTFEIQMDELHQDFFKSLKEKYPNLSIYDLRMCAYIKIGLGSKEMADLLQVLPSSINVSRSRIRKKLELNHDEDLYKFLSQFS
jgi:AraC family transcriptional regulator, chitin signaling transcriptional activator